MQDDFKKNSFYEYANNLKKYYHAYLFEVDSIIESEELILNFAKMLVCKNHYKDNTKCLDCNVCHLIDKDSYSGLKKIVPIGATIKKEQVIELQKELSLKSSDENNQVYIIKEAEKMNMSASNSLLKFIEEPVPGIFGILVTTNKRALLETIISRCFLITLKVGETKEYDSDTISNLISFLNMLLTEKEKTLPYLKQKFLNFFDNRDSIIEAFNVMEIIVDKYLNNSYKIKDEKFKYYDIIKQNLKNVSFNNLVNCLDKIVIYKNKLISIPNININLFMDRFVIDVSEVLE